MNARGACRRCTAGLPPRMRLLQLIACSELPSLRRAAQAGAGGSQPPQLTDTMHFPANRSNS
jgi:hypothetical protein